MSLKFNNPPLYVDVDNIYSLNFNIDRYDLDNNNVSFFKQADFNDVASANVESADNSRINFKISYGFNYNNVNDRNIPFKRVNKVESIIRNVKIATSNFKAPQRYQYSFPTADDEPTSTAQFVTLNDADVVELVPSLVTKIRINRIAQDATATDPLIPFQYDRFLVFGIRLNEVFATPSEDLFANFSYEILGATNSSDEYYEFNVSFIPSQSVGGGLIDFIRDDDPIYFLLTRNRLQGRVPQGLGLLLPVNFNLHGHNFSFNNFNFNELAIKRDGRERYFDDGVSLNYLMDLDRSIFNYYDNSLNDKVELTSFPTSSQLTMTFIRNLNNIQGYFIYDTYSNEPNVPLTDPPYLPTSFEYEYFGMYQISISYTLRVYPDYTAAPLNGLREQEPLTMLNIKKMFKEIDDKKEEKKEAKDKKKKKKKKLVLESITGKISPDLYQEILENLFEL